MLPAAPWQPPQPFCLYSGAPSLAVPCPAGSSLPVGLIEMSQARTSSADGVRPMPYVGPCAEPTWHSPSSTSGSNLRESIGHAPVTRDLPRLNRVVVAAHAFTARSIVEELAGLLAGRLHRAEFVDAPRHQHALLAVPLP